MELLAVVTTDAEKHWAEDSNCGAAPLCVGPKAFAALGMLERNRPGVRDALLLVCIREIFDGRKREAELAQRLEIQRDLTAEASVEVNRLHEKYER